MVVGSEIAMEKAKGLFTGLVKRPFTLVLLFI